MEGPIQRLKEYEVVLMNKIRRMKDGKPKWVAAAELEEVRRALDILERVHDGKAEIRSTASHITY
jgi:predicted DNA-binding protein